MLPAASDFNYFGVSGNFISLLQVMVSLWGT
jgi:hypothetical protein